jgi:hypothetical protein
MAVLDLSMAEHLFQEVNNRPAGQQERELLRQVMVQAAILAGPADFAKAWEDFMFPPVAEEDVDWAEIAEDLSKWGLV